MGKVQTGPSVNAGDAAARVDGQPDIADERRKLARRHQQRKEFSQALAMWHQVAELLPDDVEAATQIARVALRLKDTETTLKYAGKLVAQDAANIDALRLLAHAHQQRNELIPAMTIWQQIISRNPDDAGATIWQQIISRNPDDAGATLQLARISLWTGDVDSADTYSQALLRLAPDMPGALAVHLHVLNRMRRHDELAAILPVYAQSDWRAAVQFLDALEAAEAHRQLADVLATLTQSVPPVAEAHDWALKVRFRWLADAAALNMRGDKIASAILCQAVLSVFPDDHEAKAILYCKGR